VRLDVLVAHQHHGALAELLVDLRQGGGEGALLVLVHGCFLGVLVSVVVGFEAR
jgi:hypothetical protein